MASMRSILHPTDFSPASNPAFRQPSLVRGCESLPRALVRLARLGSNRPGPALGSKCPRWDDTATPEPADHPPGFPNPASRR